MLVSSCPCRRSRVIWWISPCWARVVNIEKTPAGRVRHASMSIPRSLLSHFAKVFPRRLWTFIMAYHASHSDRVDGARTPRRSINKYRLTSRRTQTVLQCLIILVALVVFFYTFSSLPPLFSLIFLRFFKFVVLNIICGFFSGLIQQKAGDTSARILAANLT